MKNLRKLCLAGVAAALASIGMSSHAVLVSTAGGSTAFNWSYNTGTSLLTGFGSMTLSIVNGSLSMLVSLTNTSANLGQGGDRLTGFGFGIDPNANSVSFVDSSDGGMIAAGWATGSLPANVAGVEVCAYGGSNCAGGSNGGIFAGSSDTFRILLGGSWGSSVNIDPIGLRYQTGSGSFTFPSSSSGVTTSGSSGGTSGSIPEPTSTALVGLGLGLLGLGFSRRRKTAA